MPLNCRTILVLSTALLLSSCSSAYYSAMEQLGVHKRDILVDRVEEARDSQEDAKVQFSSALTQFSTLLNFDRGDLQRTYETLEKEFEESEARVQDVSNRIRVVESVSAELFEEWEEKLSLYTNQDLRRSSENSLRETRVRYDQLIKAMYMAETKMEPVVNAFRDQVLFLKHNLNSRVIASLRTELSNKEGDISALISDREAFIAESNRFLTEMKLI